MAEQAQCRVFAETLNCAWEWMQVSNFSSQFTLRCDHPMTMKCKRLLFLLCDSAQCVMEAGWGQNPAPLHRVSNHRQTQLHRLGISQTKLGEMSAVRRTIKTNHLFATRLCASTQSNISDNPSHQPSWDCRQLLTQLHSLTARFEQACFPHQ